MTEECYLCGAKDDTAFMDSYNIGRRRLWVCPECHKLGDKEVWVRIHIRHEQIRREEDAKRSRNH